ncbi:helix-turn-helix domain-containing protein [Odoribacter laneus]|nr:helix-turn-helix domain-containing protein [Odoribacter laneus]
MIKGGQYCDITKKMPMEISILTRDDLLKQLRPLLELKDEVIALKEDVGKRTSPQYLTISQVCERLHISRSTVNRMMRNGDLKAMKAYRRVLFLESDINKLLIRKQY